MPKLDSPEVPVVTAREKRYVVIPERDIFDFPFPTIQINMTKYESGKQHFVTPDEADTIEDRIKALQRADIRLMQPRKDANAEASCRRGMNEGVQTTSF